MQRRMIALALAAMLLALSGCAKMVTETTQTISSESSALRADAAEKSGPEQEPAGAEAAEESAGEEELPLPDPEHLNLLPGRWQDAVSQRAGMTVCELEEEYQYYMEISWGSSAWETTVWSMNAAYDPGTDTVSYTDGACYENTYDETTGEITEQEILWLDAEGTFAFSEEGHLTWTDSKEERAAQMDLVRTFSEEVPEETLRERFVDVLLGLGTDTAGASLKEAQAAYELVAFAGERDLMNVDRAVFTDTMLAVIETLEEEQLKTFRENLESLSALIEEAAGETDLGESRGVFEDAGIFTEMAECTENTDTMESWNVLRRIAAQLTVDDSEIETPEEP